MAKPLSAQERVARLIERGHSRKQIGAALNRSAATVGRIARGQATGAALLPALKQVSARKPPPPGALVKPAPLAPAPPPPRPQPGEVRRLPSGAERTHLGGGRHSTRREGHPTEAQLRSDIGRTNRQVQIIATFADGKTVTVFKRGGYNAKALKKLLNTLNWLTGYLDGMGYKASEHGGIAETQVVLL